jgi:phosphatidylglycerophosphate synthase
MGQQESLEKWALSHAFLMIIGTLSSILFHHSGPLNLVVVFSFCWLIARHWDSWKVLGWYGGAANAVTGIRIILLLVAMLLAPMIGMWPTAIFVSAVQFLDLLDGYLARKFKLSSMLGAYFDKEADALFMLVLSMLLFLQGAPLWVFIIGLIRYLYVPVVYFFKPKEQAEKRFPWGVIIAVIVMVGLPIAYVLPATIQPYLLFSLSCLIILSFGRSFYFMVIS